MESRVLIAEDDSLVARALQQALVKAGYGVDVVADGMAARERLLTGAYGALVTDWMMPELDGIELVRLVRARRQPACVVLITELNIPAARSHALQQGADDFFTKPVLANDVVRSVTRWFATRAANDTAKRGVVTPIEASVANDLVHPAARTAAWGKLPSAICRVLSDTVQVPFVEGAAWTHAPDQGLASVLAMVDVEHLLELYVTIEAPRTSALAMAHAMLGETDPGDVQTLQDLVAELSNMVAGAVKTSFQPEGFNFTLGLAKSHDRAAGGYDVTMAVRLSASGIDVVVRCGVRSRNGVVVQPAQLREGMVLAENVLSSSGGLLLPAGTRLTITGADRLRGALKGRPVKVCAPDGMAA